MNGDGNPIVKARRTAEAVLSSYKKETHVTEKKMCAVPRPVESYVSDSRNICAGTMIWTLVKTRITYYLLTKLPT